MCGQWQTRSWVHTPQHMCAVCVTLLSSFVPLQVGVTCQHMRAAGLPERMQLQVYKTSCEVLSQHVHCVYMQQQPSHATPSGHSAYQIIVLF